ncbi:MAG: hypothetical protein UX43_C0011G0002 [Candidatus Giovannonibacteria bacterium GW2011_GWB1_46_20]|nr:MAG: hypothetical protein UX43_C0011G0002 [Candidatus Giovannonibacteria bacterium GW2011_GWB1_46_20]
MKKIITSSSILVTVVALAVGATSAFLSDTEASVGNTFTAGAIDLKVDNESYYNRNKCAQVSEGVWQWLDDLDNGRLFFNFRDLKPDDEGEDTISLRAENDAYVCMDVALTSDDDRSSNEPELGAGDVLEDINNTWDGELADRLDFFWWADDGDNVYEVGENALSEGIQTLTDLATTSPFSVALADSANNVWTPTAPGPIPGGETKYIGKAWCFGDLTLDPVPAGQGVSPTVNPGVTCDGKSLGNIYQTDGTTVDVSFRAFQARHVPVFLCSGEEPSLATITVIKVVTNNDGGNNATSSFQLFIDNGVTQTSVTSEVPTVVAAGAYTVSETGSFGYEATYSGDCDSDGDIVLNDGDNKTCTVTNNDVKPIITLHKVVINDNGGSAAPESFTMRVDGVVVPNGGSKSVTSNATHAITEDAKAGYHFVSLTGAPECPAVLGGTATLSEGQSISCTITNSDDGGSQ